MARVIVYERPDGGVSVVVPAPAGRQPGESQAAWLARIAARDVPEGATARIIDDGDLPSRRFRNCWRVTADAVAVDGQLARSQRLDEIDEETHRRMDRIRKRMRRARGNSARLAILQGRLDALEAVPASSAIDLQGIHSPGEMAAYEPAWPAED